TQIPVSPPPGPRPRLLALLHQDLHPSGLLRALGSLPSTHLTLGGPPHPGPGTPRLITIQSHPRKGGVTQKDETFTLLPDGSLRFLGGLPAKPEEEAGERRPHHVQTPASLADLEPPHPVTFRLQLSAAERTARAALSPPYQLSTPRKSTLLQVPGSIICAPDPPQDEDFEDPDDDLDV
ncbi:ELP5 protein, partial [Eurystomus gularis]|nr:ELP5 protein [Eurystomus gularis]